MNSVLASNDLLDGGLRGLLSLGRHFLQFGKSVRGSIGEVSVRCESGGVLTAVGVWG